MGRADKSLLAFLGLGLCVYLLATTHGEDPEPESGEGGFHRAPDPPAERPLPDSMEAAAGEVSLGSYGLGEETATHHKLPRRLTEISGLAMTGDNRLLAHDDEWGVVFEIDWRHGSIRKAFQLSDTAAPVAADFEGIAAAGDRVYLVTSSGRLYECREGAGGESVLYNIYATGVGRDCEIEGLAHDEARGELLLMCKGSRRPDRRDSLTVYHWSIDDKRLVDDAQVRIPVREFTRHLGGKKFQPSGIERHAASGNYFVVAARQTAIAEVTPRGQVLAVRRFPASWHRQAEGITFAADNTLIIADEGAGGKARLTLYPVSD